MLFLYHSNRMEILLARLVAELSEPLHPVLAPESILVQNPGMANWLSTQLAKLSGIAMNVNFPLPSSYLWRLLRRLKPDLPEVSPLDKGPLSWVLYQMLLEAKETLELGPELGVLPPHLWRSISGLGEACIRADGTKMSTLSRPLEYLSSFRLASQIADVFDQYAVFRPDWLFQWEQGQWLLPEEDQSWQCDLWRYLYGKLRQKQTQLLHRSHVWEETLEQLTDEQLKHQLPERLSVFGVSSMPNVMMSVFERLSHYMDIHWFVLNPCQHYWGDLRDEKSLAAERNRTLAAKERLKFASTSLDNLSTNSSMSANSSLALADTETSIDSVLASNRLLESSSLLECPQPLLAAMGKQGRDYLETLFEMAQHEEPLFQAPDPSESPLTLLENLQTQILDLRNGQVQPVLVDAKDNSLSFVRCYSAQREVEVLYDQLLRWFDRDPELKPRDIIVMVPDILTYAPYIESVFNNVPKERSIAWAISDRPQSAEQPLIRCFLDLVLLNEQRLEFSQVFDWLDIEAVQTRFDLDTNTVMRLRDWVEASPLCWGLDGKHKAYFGVPGKEQFSWWYALKRMLLGYATTETHPSLTVSPLSQVSGVEANAVGALGEWLSCLENHLEFLQHAHPATEWIQYWFERLNDFFADIDSSKEALLSIRQALQHCLQTLNVSQEDPLIDQRVLYDVLSNALMSEPQSQRFFVGQVNFCTLMPMRSIPFKRVCLLGMNEGDYPRVVTPLNFDLLSKHFRKGDRSRRNDDRYLFLEALLSARQSLWISYRHKHLLDNTPLMPSVLVSELVDYIDQAFVLENTEQSVSHHMTTDHPLQPFHPSYFYPDDRQSYQTHWLIQPTNDADADKGAFGQVDSPSESLANRSAVLWQRSSNLPASHLEWSVEAFVKAFRHLPRCFLQERFGVHWQLPQKGPDALEPYALDGLARFKLRQTLLNVRMNQRSEQALLKDWRQSGLVSDDITGWVQIETLLQEIAPLWNAAAPYLKGQGLIEDKTQSAVEVMLTTEIGMTINGWLNPDYQGYRVEMYPGKHPSRALFVWSLRHVLYCAACRSGSQSLWFGLDKQWYLPRIAQPEAQELVNEFAHELQQALVRPTPFIDYLSFELINPEEQQPDKRKAKALSEWEKALDDPQSFYLRRLFAQDPAVFEKIEPIAQRLYQPFVSLWESSSL